MTISNHPETFFGKKVIDYQVDAALLPLEQHVYRLSTGYDSELQLVELLQGFLDKVELSKLDALIIGEWTDAYEESPQAAIDELIKRSAELSALKALFIGDMTYEECEISWIIQGSYQPLLDALPQLQHLQIRGSTDLELAPFQHQHLHTLIIECGGLPVEIVHNLTKSTLPALKHLELWLGTDDYGFSGSIIDYAALLKAINPSRLSYLGLRNANIADKVASYLADQAWLADLDTLDLSLGNMSDAGASALLASPYIKQLGTLNLTHHYISTILVSQLQALPINVIIDEPQEAEEYNGKIYRYVAVSE